MKNVLLFLFILTAFVSAQQLSGEAPAELQKNDHTYFIANEGQWPDEVRYLTKVSGMNAWITDFGVVYDYYHIQKNYTTYDLEQVEKFEKEQFKAENTLVEGHVIRIAYESVNTGAVDIPSGKLNTYHNYFIGKDESKWASRVPLYEEVIVEDIYDGIDIRYYYDEGLIRYDYKVEVGADASQIALSLEGADSYSVNDDGELVIETSLGEIFHGKLLAYQNTWYGSKPVEVGFSLTSGGNIAIDVTAYDTDKELIIDPLVYSTFLSGILIDFLVGVDKSTTGVVLLTDVHSSDYPTTFGAYSTYQGGGDFGVTQLDANYQNLVFSTCIGGINADNPRAIVIDGSDNIYLCGNNWSGDFPLTAGAFDNTSVGFTEGVVLKLSSDGTSLLFSSYIGGSDNEDITDINVDVSGNVYVTGATASTDYPVTAGVFDNFNDNVDAVISIINSTGTALTASTYLGQNGIEYLYKILLDGSNVCAAGYTEGNFPITTGAYDEIRDGNSDGVFVKMNSTLSTLQYSTYLGGSFYDMIYDAELDGSGNFYLTGSTTSSDFPVTSGAFDETKNAGDDCFISKFDNGVTSLIFSTYLGGSGDDTRNKIDLINTNEPVILVETKSNDFPVVPGSYDILFNGGLKDVTVSKFSADGSSLLYSTYLGGSDDDVGNGLKVIDGSNAVIVGETKSADFPITPGVYKESFSSLSTGFVSQLELVLQPSLQLIAPNGGENWEAGTAQTISWTSIAVSDVKLEYTTGVGWNTIVNSIDASLGSFNWTVPASASTTCMVRVSDASNAIVNDASDGFFTIFLPSVTVDSPNGGETYRAGTMETITWTANGIDNVRIEYSTDSGSNWNLIDPSVAGSLGTYDWAVPNVSSTSCLVRLSDDLVPTIVDQSDAVFTIGNPTATINYTAGWNILSVPFALDNPDPATVFPTKTSDVFAYSSGYYIIYNLQPEQGFWVQFPASGSETVDGQGVSDSTVQVFTGWNLIGTTEYDVTVADITSTPGGIVQTDFFEYGGGYTPVTTLVEGKGYWVKCSQAGELLLPRQIPGPPKAEPLLIPEENWITVTVSDAAGNSQQLYVADASGNFELPPLPPNEIFDVRFGDDSYLCDENTISKLRFQSEDYPLTISVSGGNLKLTDDATGTVINRQLLDGESMTITNKNIGNLNINTVEIPADYILYQNYPNPFNPATTIKFGLPQASKVDITVYDQLGQKVETLISEELDAGYHELEWNAMQYSSGVYFYTINSGNFKAVKKMLLLK